ncbi:MAG: hypothetical protein UR43_C0015G0019 [candidate division TM6 bacterium GW2011_GWF2_33_332]|nr:MAG: hypothetical protein UR43_C0015G0019 [candidate division TM6 bacterium GW2011_GWF2_33_332]
MADKFVSVYRVIEEVYQNEGYAHELDWSDAISWIGKALGLIAAPAIYQSKITGLDILTPHVECVDYRGNLPIDFVEILVNGVRDSTSKQIYTYSGNVNKDYGSPTYVVKDQYIDISEETATLELAYKAFMIDDHGFPMVPDNERVIEAVRAFVTYRIDHKLWRKDKISDKVYSHSEKEWLWYVGSAQNSLRIIGPERRRMWTKYFTQVLPTIMTSDPENIDEITEDYSGYTKPNVTYHDLPSTP